MQTDTPQDTFVKESAELQDVEAQKDVEQGVASEGCRVLQSVAFHRALNSELSSDSDGASKPFFSFSCVPQSPATKMAWAGTDLEAQKDSQQEDKAKQGNDSQAHIAWHMAQDMKRQKTPTKQLTPSTTASGSESEAEHEAEVALGGSKEITKNGLKEEDKGEEGKDDPTPVRLFSISAPVRIGGAILALNAGMVNAIAFHVLKHFVSHLTGTLSKVAIGVEDDQKAESDTAAFILLSFVLGSTLTGFLVAKDTVHFGMALYDLCLLCESALLVLTTFTHEYKIAIYLAAAACGLQNGMATHWGGAVVRTTHVTGLFTDVGLVLGRLLSLLCRKRCGAKFDDFDRAFVQDDLSKLSVLLMIAWCFVCGVFAGAHLHQDMKHLAFLVPASITGAIGLAYLIYRVFVLGRSLFSSEEMEAIDVPVQMQVEVVAEIEGPGSPRSPSKRDRGALTISRAQANQLELNHAGRNMHVQQ